MPELSDHSRDDLLDSWLVFTQPAGMKLLPDHFPASFDLRSVLKKNGSVTATSWARHTRGLRANGEIKKFTAYHNSIITEYYKLTSLGSRLGTIFH